jgi:hypothetical protein
MESATRALVVVRHDVDESVDKEEFDDWYLNEHFPENLRVPGFLAASRFELSPQGAPDGLQRYLTVWELASEDALQHPQYLKRRENPSERNAQMRTVMKNVVRAVYLRMGPTEPDR